MNKGPEKYKGLKSHCRAFNSQNLKSGWATVYRKGEN